jgi:hypothetical protein
MNIVRPAAWHRPATPPRPVHPLRRLAAAVLRSTSHLLARMAQHVAEPTAPALPRLPESLEFYADASAPEGAPLGGALYLDGRLVGYLPGVRRL